CTLRTEVADEHALHFRKACDATVLFSDASRFLYLLVRVRGLRTVAIVNPDNLPSGFHQHLEVASVAVVDDEDSDHPGRGLSRLSRLIDAELGAEDPKSIGKVFAKVSHGGIDRRPFLPFF